MPYWDLSTTINKRQQYLKWAQGSSLLTIPNPPFELYSYNAQIKVIIGGYFYTIKSNLAVSVRCTIQYKTNIYITLNYFSIYYGLQFSSTYIVQQATTLLSEGNNYS